jgi:hypothetical protein
MPMITDYHGDRSWPGMVCLGAGADEAAIP